MQKAQLKQCFIIIDGFFSGAELVDRLAAFYWNASFLHIITATFRMSAAASGYQFYSGNPLYLEELFYDGDYDGLLVKLSRFEVIGAICCYEGDGILLREQLGQQYKLPANDPAKQEARRNKFAMTEHLKAAAINHIPQAILELPEDILSASAIFDFPVVLKPVDGAGSDGFHYCLDMEALTTAFADIRQNGHRFCRQIDRILLQKFIDGQEYAVNTVSYAGNMIVTDIWEYENLITKDGRRVCLSCTLAEVADKRDLTDYCKSCLDALGYENGAAHTEIIYSKGKYFMVESNARLMGGLSNSLMNKCLMTTQLEALALSLTTPQMLADFRQEVRERLKIVNIISLQDGTLAAIQDFERIARLRSYLDFVEIVKIGDAVTETHSPETCIGRIWLRHSDPVQLEADYAYIRNIESSVFLIM